MTPTFILKVYNPEYLKAQGDEPMPVVLTHTEAWDLKSVDGLDPSFLGLDATTTSDKYGQVNIQAVADVRTVSFVLALAPGKVEDALIYLSRYLVSGCYATLTTADNGRLWMPTKITGYECNRWSNGVEVTINLTCLDRYWHYNADAITASTFTLLSDAPTRPIIVANFTAQAAISQITINHSYEKYDYAYAGAVQLQQRTIATKRVYRLTTPISEGDEAIVWYNGADNNLSVTFDGITYYPEIDVAATTWDGLLLPGENTLTIAETTNATYEITTNPVFATYPKTLVSAGDGLILSPRLTAGNIRSGVQILGVTGTYTGPTYDIYDGPFDITPTNAVQELDTSGKLVRRKIRVLPAQDNAGFNKPLAGSEFRLDIKSLDLSKRDYWSGKTSFDRYFMDLTNLETITLPPYSADTNRWGENVTSYNHAFSGCTNLRAIDLSWCNFDHVTDAAYMFYNCTYLGDVQMPTYDLPALTDAAFMFARCTTLSVADLRYWHTAALLNMAGMFFGCTNLSSVRLDNLDTANVVNMATLFYNCSNLEYLNLSGLNTANVTNMANMFRGCSRLAYIDFPAAFPQNAAVNSLDFGDCPLNYAVVGYLIDALPAKGTTDAAVVKFASNVWQAALLSRPELATIAEAKCWTIEEA